MIARGSSFQSPKKIPFGKEAAKTIQKTPLSIGQQVKHHARGYPPVIKHGWLENPPFMDETNPAI